MKRGRLGRRARLDRVVSGALVCTINDHGPIDQDGVRSATKRIVGQLLGEEMARPHESGQATIDHLRKRIKEMEYGHGRVVEQNDRLRTERNQWRDLAYTLSEMTAPGLTAEEFKTKYLDGADAS